VHHQRQNFILSVYISGMNHDNSAAKFTPKPPEFSPQFSPEAILTPEEHA